MAFYLFESTIINFSPGERVLYATTSAAIMVSVFNKGKPTEAINDSISKFQFSAVWFIYFQSFASTS